MVIRVRLIEKLTRWPVVCVCVCVCVLVLHAGERINYGRYPPVQELPVQSALLLPADGDTVTADAYTTWGLDLKGYAWAGVSSYISSQ